MTRAHAMRVALFASAIVLLILAGAAGAQITTSPAQAVQAEFRDNLLNIDRVAVPGTADYAGVRLRLQPDGSWTLDAGGPDQLARRGVRVTFDGSTVNIPYLTIANGSTVSAVYANVRFGLAGATLSVVGATPVGAIQGSVTNSADGTPIAGALVSVAPGHQAAYTDAAGRYLLVGVSGSVSVQASAGGFQAFSSRAVVTGPDAVAPADFSAARSPVGTLRGSVTSGGVASSGLTVLVRNQDSFAVAGKAVTNAAGAFTLPTLPAGRYLAIVERTAGLAVQSATIAAGQSTDISMSLPAADASPAAAGFAAIDAPQDGEPCIPKVGIFADGHGDPSGEIFNQLNLLVRSLQAIGPSLGYIPVNKVPGVEENDHVHYFVFIDVDALTHRLVDGRSGRILDAGYIESGEQAVDYFRNTLRSRISDSDRITQGSGPAVTLSAGSCVRLSYDVDTFMGRVAARADRGLMLGPAGGTLGYRSFDVFDFKAEALAYRVPENTAPGADSVSMVGYCRYTPNGDVPLSPITVTTTPAITIADDFANLSGGPYHQHRTSGPYVELDNNGTLMLAQGTDVIEFGSASGAEITWVSIVAWDNCGRGCTLVTFTGKGLNGDPKSTTLEVPEFTVSAPVTFDSRAHGFAKITSLALSSLEGGFLRLRGSGATNTCTAEDLAWLGQPRP